MFERANQRLPPGKWLPPHSATRSRGSITLDPPLTRFSGLQLAPNQPPTKAPESRRFFALDSLRALMMLLGIYLHGVVGYSAGASDTDWPFKDPHPTAIFDWTIGYIHAFRMPVFYVIAGFFAALLIDRRGARSFLRNRVQRILVPFVVGWTLLFPMVFLLAVYSRVADEPHAWNQACQSILSLEFVRHRHPLHLWFLEYLLLFYMAQAAAILILPRVLPPRALLVGNSMFRWVVKCPWKPLILAVPMFLVLSMTRYGSVETPQGFFPAVRILLPYSITFLFGWLLFENIDLLDELQRGALTQVALTFGVVVLIVPIAPWLDLHRTPARFIVAAATSLLMWLMICGLTGVFLRYLNRPLPRMRYLADSSYWLYLIHMVALMALQILLRPVPWPAALKAWVVLVLAVPVMLLSYHYCVRPTVIGQILNGRRYPTWSRSAKNGQSAAFAPLLPPGVSGRRP